MIFLEHNGVSDPELQFFMKLVISRIVYMQKAWWILSCFHLIYSSFSLHIKHIIELGRAKEYTLRTCLETAWKTRVVLSGPIT